MLFFFLSLFNNFNHSKRLVIPKLCRGNKKNFLVSESVLFSVPVRHADTARNGSTDNNYTNQTLISLSYIFLMTQCNQIKSFGNDLVVCFFLVGETLIMCKYRSRKKKVAQNPMNPDCVVLYIQSTSFHCVTSKPIYDAMRLYWPWASLSCGVLP